MGRARLPIVALFCLALTLTLALAAAGCGEDSAQSSGEKPEVTVPDGPPPKQIETEDLIEGEGPVARKGDRVAIHYVGVAFDKGQEYESSWAGRPYEITLGNREALDGLDPGIEGMRVGGRREVVLPPRWAYGKGGFPPNVGENEAVLYVIDLVSLSKPSG